MRPYQHGGLWCTRSAFGRSWQAFKMPAGHEETDPHLTGLGIQLLDLRGSDTGNDAQEDSSVDHAGVPLVQTVHLLAQLTHVGMLVFCGPLRGLLACTHLTRKTEPASDRMALCHPVVGQGALYARGLLYVGPLVPGRALRHMQRLI